MSCGVGHRRGSDPALLWLWRSLAATALIGPLAWEPPYATRSSPIKGKKKTITQQSWLTQRIILKMIHTYLQNSKQKCI